MCIYFKKNMMKLNNSINITVIYNRDFINYKSKCVSKN